MVMHMQGGLRTLDGPGAVGGGDGLIPIKIVEIYGISVAILVIAFIARCRWARSCTNTRADTGISGAGFTSTVFVRISLRVFLRKFGIQVTLIDIGLTS